jgi:hypothetical protein
MASSNTGVLEHHTSSALQGRLAPPPPVQATVNAQKLPQASTDASCSVYMGQQHTYNIERGTQSDDI